MIESGNIFDGPPLVQEVSQAAQRDYLEAALRGAEQTGRAGVHRHDALELATRHQLLPNQSLALCYVAARRAGEVKRQLDWLPHEIPAEGWIDELE